MSYTFSTFHKHIPYQRGWLRRIHFRALKANGHPDFKNCSMHLPEDFSFISFVYWGRADLTKPLLVFEKWYGLCFNLKSPFISLQWEQVPLMYITQSQLSIINSYLETRWAWVKFVNLLLCFQKTSLIALGRCFISIVKASWMCDIVCFSVALAAVPQNNRGVQHRWLRLATFQVSV